MGLVNGGSLMSLSWNNNNFVPDGSALIFGSGDADNTITFTNPIDFNGAQRTIQAVKGTTSAVAGILSGALTGTGSSGIIKTGSGTLALTGTNTYSGNTTVNGGALKMVGASAWGPALSGTSGTTDIQSGRAVFDYSGAGETSPGSTIGTILHNGFPTGFTTATDQIHSSTAGGNIGLGWQDDTGAKKVTVARTYYGDANVDGVVNSGDFSVLATNYNLGSGAVWALGDFNYDGKVNALDFNAIATNYGASPLASPVLGALVPEPGSALLGAAGIALVFSRRRKSNPSGDSVDVSRGVAMPQP
jgi:autotransporter-associated beta strand protein